MNRRSRHLVVLTVAVVTATIASFAVYRALLQRPARAQELPNQRVVVVKHAMAIGTQLTEPDLKVVSWPADSPLPNAINDMKDAVNRGLLTTVLENEPLTTNKIAAAGAGLPPAIPAGMRAIAVKVNHVNPRLRHDESGDADDVIDLDGNRPHARGIAGESPAPAAAILFVVIGSFSSTAVSSPRLTTSFTSLMAFGSGLSAGQDTTFRSDSVSWVPMAIAC